MEYKEKHGVKYIIFFSIVFFVILFYNINQLNSIIFEGGDYAANTLLVLKAKSLSLLQGNYSRIGFNHPGPAILYVLAFGEWVFYDILRFFPSPFSGQMVAGYLYNSFWLTVVFYLLEKLLKTTQSALLAWSGFVFVMAFVSIRFFDSLWFPYLYAFPFAAALLAFARLAQGKADSLFILAISVGFLCNGHASFPAILVLIGAVVVTGNYILSYATPQERILSWHFLVLNRASIILSLVVLFVFFLPLLVLTVIKYPGPIGDYISYGKHHHDNNLKVSLLYLSHYWGGLPIMIFSISIILISVFFDFSRVNQKWKIEVSHRQISLSLLASTLVVLLYVILGIDDLGEFYICFFYFTVPALMFGFVLVLFANVFSYRMRIAAANIFILGNLGFFCQQAYTSTQQQYSYSEAPRIFETLKNVATGGRVALDVDNTTNPVAWGPVVSAIAYGMRQGSNLICIHRSWHILFTRSMLCSDSELVDRRRIIVSARLKPDDDIIYATRDGIRFGRFTPHYSSSSLNVTVAKNQALFRDYLLGDGWSDPESEFTWSMGSRSVLNLYLGDQLVNGQLFLDMGSFLPFSNTVHKLRFFVNGELSAEDTFSHANERHVSVIPLRDVHGLTRVTIEIDRPISPRDAGVNGDERPLTLALYGMKFIPGVQN